MATSTSERVGTKATAKFVRMSASKVRVVLDLIRGKEVAEAIHILEFSSRLAAEPILKVLYSAVANAEHNDDQTEDELFVSECFADQGPTLKRFRPRARGRAGRIHKQTCHITVTVARLSEDELELRREREERQEASGAGKKQSETASRRKRVAKSKAKKEAKAAQEADVEDDAPQDDVADEVAEDEVTADDTVDDDIAEDVAGTSTASEEEE